MSVPVLSVEGIDLTMLKSNPQQLIVTANGTVPTLGWTNGELALREHIPADGVYEFDFIATPPSGIVGQAIMPISASWHFESIPDDLTGVRVFAKQNSKEEHLIPVHPISTPSVENDFEPYEEAVLGIEMLQDELRIRVPSGGCTTKEHIHVEVNKGFTGMPPFQVTVYRVQPDFCRAYLPDGVVLTYTLEELDLKSSDWFCLDNNIGRTPREMD